jgi:hypothetical protein
MLITTTPAVAAATSPIQEPGLAWLTPEVWNNPPLGYNGLKLIWRLAELCDDSMAPCFPSGCCVNVAPVYELKNLVVGRAYLSECWHPETGQPFCQLARLVSVHDTHLLVQADRIPTRTIWPLRADERTAVWDVYEVTHYVKWPGPHILNNPTPESAGRVVPLWAAELTEGKEVAACG